MTKDRQKVGTGPPDDIDFVEVVRGNTGRAGAASMGWGSQDVCFHDVFGCCLLNDPDPPQGQRQGDTVPEENDQGKVESCHCNHIGKTPTEHHRQKPCSSKGEAQNC